MNKISIGLLLALIIPGIGNAQTPNLNWFQTLATEFGTLVTDLIPIVIALALLVFIWGLVKFISNSGDDAAKQDGKNKMIWGVIALFVIVAVWGIVGLISQITGVNPAADPEALPGVTL